MAGGGNPARASPIGRVNPLASPTCRLQREGPFKAKARYERPRSYGPDGARRMTRLQTFELEAQGIVTEVRFINHCGRNKLVHQRSPSHQRITTRRATPCGRLKRSDECAPVTDAGASPTPLGVVSRTTRYRNTPRVMRVSEAINQFELRSA